MRKIFLDTNAYSNYFKGDLKIKTAIDASSQVLLSVVSLGELCFGFKLGDRFLENLEVLSRFVEDPKIVIVSVEEKAAFIYGGIRHDLRKRGTPIPGNDTWIAAQAIETNSTLITYDSHFLNVKGLKIWKGLGKSV